MLKKTLVLLTLTIFLIGSLVGCGGASGNEGNAPEGEAALKVTGNVDSEKAWTEESVRAMNTIEAERENKEGEMSTYTGVSIKALLEKPASRITPRRSSSSPRTATPPRPIWPRYKPATTASSPSVIRAASASSCPASTANSRSRAWSRSRSSSHPVNNPKLFVGIDDTDTLESRGTGHLAREVAAALAANLAVLGVTRHQLLVDPRVPYTAKNSSAAIVLGPNGRLDPADVMARVRAVMREHFNPGSDPGLCVAAHVPAEVTAFGRRVQRDVVTQMRRAPWPPRTPSP